MSTGDGWLVLQAAASPRLSRSELCLENWAEAGGQALGDSEVSASGT